MIRYDWLPLQGNYEKVEDIIIFKGEEVFNNNGKSSGPKIGNLIFNEYFNEGIIKAKVEFDEVDNEVGCDIIFYYKNSESGPEMATIGIDRNQFSMFELKSLKDGKWEFHKFSGEGAALSKNHTYELEMEYRGNLVNLKVNGIEVLQARLPFFTTRSQIGVWSRSKYDIKIHDFEVENVNPKVFVIMQFTEQFNELYSDVIKGICENYRLDVVRADDIYNNGMIIHDITENICNSKIIIADITPKNPNVYYEVGYSHALEKPIILLAEEGTELPFDIKPYRVIFYKNSISGKRLVEENLKKHLNEIL